MAPTQTTPQNLTRQEQLAKAQQLTRIINAGQAVHMGMAQSTLMDDRTKKEVLQRSKQMDRMQRARRAHAEGQAAEGMRDSWRAKAAAALHGMDLKMESQQFDEQEEEEFEQSATDRLAANQGAARLNAQKGKKRTDAQKKCEQEIKNKAKAGIERGVIYTVDLILGSVDASTFGVTFLVDMFLYLFTFGWLNVQLFYGTFLKGGNDPVIAPLTWDPIPPILPDTYLYGILIAIDIALIIGFVFAITTTVILIGIAYQVLYHPIETIISNPGSLYWLPGILIP